MVQSHIMKSNVLNNVSAVNCVVLEQRIEELEQQYKHRQNNFKQRVREEVIEYLEQLKK